MISRDFFATCSDLERNIRGAEKRFSVKYIQDYFGPSEKLPPTYYSALDIPELGFADKPGAFISRCFLVTLADREFNIQPVDVENSGLWFNVRTTNNCYALSFRPGGWHNNKYFVGGRIGQGIEFCDELKPFCDGYIRALTRGFKRIVDRNEAWWLGPEAIELYKQGVPCVTADEVNYNLPFEFLTPGLL